MQGPKGTLTGLQLEVMEAIWSRRDGGATVAEIWETLARTRKIARTTALTLIQRLEARGWLRRNDTQRPARFSAARSRSESAEQLATEFVDQYFGGSAASLVMSLLGSKRYNAGDVRNLRKLLDEHK